MLEMVKMGIRFGVMAFAVVATIALLLWVVALVVEIIAQLAGHAVKDEDKHD